MKRGSCNGLFVLLVMLALAGQAFASGDSPGAFDTANKLYEQGKFPEAASAYEKIIGSGPVSPALYFNLGNALYKSDQIGRALAAYRQAERIAPRDPELRANLQFVRELVQNPTLQPTRWQHWLGSLTLNEWTVLTAVALWLWLALLTLPQWQPPASSPHASAGIQRVHPSDSAAPTSP